jgi:hypothetical protein
VGACSVALAQHVPEMAFLCRNADEGWLLMHRSSDSGKPTMHRLPRDRTLGIAVTYRSKASECAVLAAQTKGQESKHMLEKTAEHWKVLADGIEKYEAKIWRAL